MAVEMRHLRALTALADAGTFTDAAIALGISQAAVSRSIAQLEANLGVGLVHRSSRRVAFTDLGRTALGHARRALREVDALQKSSAAGTLRVGYAWSGLGGHTHDLYRLWETEIAGTELILSHYNSPTGGLAEGVCDAALVRGAPAGHDYHSEQVGLERRVCAVARQDKWARRRGVRLQEIAARPLALNRPTGTTSEALFAPDVPVRVVETTDTDHWLETIARAKAVGVTSEATAVYFPRPDVRYIPIKDAPPIPVYLMWAKHNIHPHLQRLAGMMQQVYREGAPAPGEGTGAGSDDRAGIAVDGTLDR